MFRKLLHLIGVISVDNQTTSLEFAEKLVWLKWRVFIRGYLIGVILYPWVWVWGLWVLLLGFIWYVLGDERVTYVRYIFSLRRGVGLDLKNQNYVVGFVIILSFILLLNYTISYVTYRKNVAIGILIWILSLWLLISSFLLVYITWQFNLSFFR